MPSKKKDYNEVSGSGVRNYLGTLDIEWDESLWFSRKSNFRVTGMSVRCRKCSNPYPASTRWVANKDGNNEELVHQCTCGYKYSTYTYERLVKLYELHNKRYAGM